MHPWLGTYINYHSIRRASMIGIVIMLLILTAIGTYGLDQLNKLNEIRKSLKHTNDVIVNLHSIYSTLEDAETGQRGFLITGDENYLATYNDASSKINGYTKQLRQLNAGRPYHKADVEMLQKSTSEKFNELKNTIELRRAKGFEAARELVLTNRGKDKMDEIRDMIDRFYEHENKLLAEREIEQDKKAKSAFLWLFFLCSAAIACQVIMGFITISFIEREKLSTEKLREQADLLDLSRDAVIVHDLDGTIRYWNRGAEKMYGYHSEEVLGKTSYKLLKVELPKPLEEIQKDILAKGYWEDELVHYTAKGNKIVVASRHTVNTDTDGNPVSILEINTDITAHKQAEQRQMALAEMKRVNSELEQFTYIASHDLQEPLRAIAGCLRILEKSHKDNLDEEAKELIHYAVDGSIRMSTLINDLLALSRVDKNEAVLERIDLTDVLNEGIKNIIATVNETKAVITHDHLPVINAEKALLVQLFQNLLMQSRPNLLRHKALYYFRNWLLPEI